MPPVGASGRDHGAGRRFVEVHVEEAAGSRHKRPLGEVGGRVVACLTATVTHDSLRGAAHAAQVHDHERVGIVGMIVPVRPVENRHRADLVLQSILHAVPLPAPTGSPSSWVQSPSRSAKKPKLKSTGSMVSAATPLVTRASRKSVRFPPGGRLSAILRKPAGRRRGPPAGCAAGRLRRVPRPGSRWAPPWARRDRPAPRPCAGWRPPGSPSRRTCPARRTSRRSRRRPCPEFREALGERVAGVPVCVAGVIGDVRSADLRAAHDRAPSVRGRTRGSHGSCGSPTEAGSASSGAATCVVRRPSCACPSR